MGRKHKHEEHENHERWVISYADLVTLLFALFVVLYALGEIKLKKLKQVSQSMAFAFHFDGHGKTYEDGIHERGDVGGDLLEGAMILNPQRGDMKEYLIQTLPNEFEEISGRSLDIVLSDDTVAFSGPMSSFFSPGSKRLRPEVHPWLTKLVEGGHSLASSVRVRLEAPKVRIGKVRETGAPYYSLDLCLERIGFLDSLIGLMSNVGEGEVTHEFVTMPTPASAATWEDKAVIHFAFANPDQ